MKSSGICALAMLLLASPVAAQSPPLADQFIRRVWGTADGLPQNTVTAMVQTRDGYLWLGTFGGLVRFDGHTFTVFEPGNTPGLASARITTLYEDRQGVLWVGTEGGLSRLEHGRFTKYDMTDGLPHAGILSMLEDRRGRLWVSTGRALGRFDGRAFLTIPVESMNVTLSMAEAPAGGIWAGTWDGVVRFLDGDVADIVAYTPGPTNQAWRNLFFDSKGRLWAGSDVLSRWDGWRFVEVPLPGSRRPNSGISAIAEDRQGNLWIGTLTGAVYRWRDGSVDTYTTGEGLSSGAIRSLLVDRDDSIWIGTDVGGLSRLKRRRVFSFPREGEIEQSIGPIVDDGADGLWIGGTCGGLMHFRAGAFRVYGEKDGITHRCFWSLMRDPDGTVWAGSMGGGLFRLAAGRVTNYMPQNRGLSGSQVNAIMRDRDGGLWLGTDQGADRFHDGRFTHYGPREGLDQAVLTLAQDHSGALWFGGMSGVHRLKDGHFTKYTTAQGLSHDHVRAVYEDADHTIWIGTYGGGLNRLKDGRFTAYRIKDGLHDNAVSRIIEDGRGNLWMSGNKGVFRVARSQLNDFAEGRTTYITSVSYGMADGMIIDETNGGQPAGWRDRDGKFWFPTIKGLVSIDPETDVVKPPPIFVERAPGTLGPGGSDAEFHYTAVDLGAGEKTRFRYRLAGYDREWIEAGSRRIAYYTNIPPGRYQFEVAATNRDGVWTTTPASVALTVTPLLWQRRGVQAAGLLMLLLVTGFVVRAVSGRRGRARLAEVERENALERERGRIARDLHDDLGSRLTYIAMMADKATVPSVADAARDAARTMDELVWAVNARNDSVEGFAQYFSQFALEHVGAAGVRCRLKVSDEFPALGLGADIRRHLYLACKEAVNNAVKHAAAGEIGVAIHVTGDRLVVEVADDGNGFPAHVNPTGNGLKNYRERMSAIGGTVDVVSAAGQGTRVVFKAPLTPALR